MITRRIKRWKRSSPRLPGHSYVYEPLPKKSTRFLELLPGSGDEPLRCRIFASSLADAPPYEALSYVWGPQTPLYELICDGDGSSVLAIGPSLHDALLHLRFEPSSNPHPRVLWVDRICINQDDLKERTSQVLQMDVIYRQCQQTLAWLGPEDADTRDAFDMARFAYHNKIGADHQRFSSELMEHLSDFKPPPATLERVESLLDCWVEITRLPWFERAWTFQEAVLPPKISLVRGLYSVSLDELSPVFDLASKGGPDRMAGHARLILGTRHDEREASEPVHHAVKLPPSDLIRCLVMHRAIPIKSSDPRDFVYSLLGLYDPSVSRILPPDYSMSVRDLFVNVAHYIISVSKSLRSLSAVESPKYCDDDITPSWVPDWRAPAASIERVLLDCNIGCTFEATRGSPYSTSAHAGLDELEVQGILVGIVEQVGEYCDSDVVSDFHLKDTYPHTSQPVVAALTQASLLGRKIWFRNTSAEHPKRHEVAAMYGLADDCQCEECNTSEVKPPSLKTQARFHGAQQSFDDYWYRKHLQSRAFFTTRSGHFGFGPKCTVADDRVYLLLGSDMPLILRPSGDKFTLVGACHVHGIMYGEALHHSFRCKPELYPGSVPGGLWQFEGLGMQEASWTPVTRTGEVLNDGAKQRQSLWFSRIPEKSRVRRYSFEEAGRDPVLIEASEMILV